MSVAAQVWYVVSNDVGTVLAVYGSALESDALAKGRAIRESTRCPVALHAITALWTSRPHVGQSISMRGEMAWL